MHPLLENLTTTLNLIQEELNYFESCKRNSLKIETKLLELLFKQCIVSKIVLPEVDQILQNYADKNYAFNRELLKEKNIAIILEDVESIIRNKINYIKQKMSSKKPYNPLDDITDVLKALQINSNWILGLISKTLSQEEE